MSNVIQELLGDEITLDQAHVHDRVEDWKMRVSRLFADISSWLPDLKSDRSDTIEMNEELMREYGVAPTRLPVLRLSNDDGQVAKFVPRGLWIIGANGRLNLFATNGQFVIVDRADYRSPERWEIAPALQRLRSEPLSKSTLLAAMR